MKGGVFVGLPYPTEIAQCRYQPLGDVGDVTTTKVLERCRQQEPVATYLVHRFGHLRSHVGGSAHQR
ncbi:MAG: hypothetical protein QOI07_3802 [Verrucomicrobiota bacterium]